MAKKELADIVKSIAISGSMNDLIKNRLMFQKMVRSDDIQTENAAKALLDLMKNKNPEISLRAEQLLYMLNIEAVNIVSMFLESSDSELRDRILISILNLCDNFSLRKPQKNYFDIAIKNLIPYFENENTPELSRVEENEEPKEYQEPRICDIVFIIVAKLNNDYSKYSYFLELNYSDRDSLINDVKSSLKGSNQFIS